MKKYLLLLLGIFLIILQKSYAQTPVAYYPFNGNANDVVGTNNGTVNGATLTTDRFGNANSAYSFDGVDDNVSIANNAVFNFTNYTISLWFKYNGAGTAGKSIWSLISKNGNGNGFDDAFHIWIASSDKSTGGRVGNGSSEFYVGNATAIDNGAWHQSALVFDNTNDLVKLYLDGVLISSVANTSNPFNNGADIKIGFWEAFNNFFNGAIDEVKIYNTALGDVEILNEFTNTSVQNYRSVTSGNWNSPATWERFDGSSFVPATAAPSSPDGVITIRSGNNVTISSVVNIDQTIIEAGGTLTQNISLTISNGVGDDLTVNGNWVWNTDNIGGPGNVVIASTGTLLLATGNQKNSDGYNITNNGTIDWQGGFLNFGSTPSTLTNNGLFTISGNNEINSGVPFTIINTGTITKASSGTTSFLNGPISLNNSGTINFNAGIFNLNIASTNSGIWSFGGGTVNRNNNNVLNWNSGASMIGTGAFSNSTSTITLNANLAIPATISFTHLAGTINGNGDLTINNDFINNGQIEGAGALIVTGNMNWIQGSLSRSYTVPAGKTFTLSTGNQKNSNGFNITNNGTMDWQDGFINLGTAANTLTNNGQFTISGNNQINSGVPFTFLNNGTISKTTNGVTNFSGGNVLITNSGTIKGIGTFMFGITGFINNGIIAPGTSPGLLTIDNINNIQPLSANSTLQIEMLNNSGAGTGHDQLVRNGSLTLAGTLTVAELSMMPNGSYTIINLTSGTISGNFSTTNLPFGYTLQVNATNVELIRTLSTLPLNLISFSGSKQNSDALLKWKTANEVNVNRFEIQRSDDGQNFATVGTVLPGSISYSFNDAGIFNSKSLVFFRLKSIDDDGKFTYSNIISLSSQLITQLSVFPNPVKDVVTINGLKQNGTIRLFDISGKLLQQKEVIAQTITIDMSVYVNGMYIVQYSQNGEVVNQKVLKQ